MTDFRIVCCTCRRTVAPAKATLRVRYADIRNRQAALDVHIQDPLAYLVPLAEWRVECHDCDERGDCYWTPAEYVDTWPRLLAWSAHIALKGWAIHTNLREFAQATATGQADVGLVPISRDGLAPAA